MSVSINIHNLQPAAVRQLAACVTLDLTDAAGNIVTAFFDDFTALHAWLRDVMDVAYAPGPGPTPVLTWVQICQAVSTDDYMCSLDKGHEGDHKAWSSAVDLCATWGAA